MNRILHGMITERAKRRFAEEVTAKNWERWVDVWIGTAEEVEEDFHKEGLHQTSAAVARMIQETKRYRT
jgi:hypothetical protein